MSPWIRVADNLWVGDTFRPLHGEFDHALTVSKVPPRTDNGLRHRHFLIPTTDAEADELLDIAVPWLQTRWQAGRRLLIQSPGYTWAELIIAGLWVHLGADHDEAITSLRQARPQALTEQPFPDRLRAWRRHA